MKIDACMHAYTYATHTYRQQNSHTLGHAQTHKDKQDVKTSNREVRRQTDDKTRTHIDKITNTLAYIRVARYTDTIRGILLQYILILISTGETRDQRQAHLFGGISCDCS